MENIKIIVGRKGFNEINEQLLENMFKMRNEIFNGRNKWKLPIDRDREIDSFDVENTVYIICYNVITKEVIACWRAIQHLNKSMLYNVFPELLGDNLNLIPENCWELSRFAVRKKIETAPSVFMSSNDITRSMFQAALYFFRKKNVGCVVTVVSPALYRLLTFNGLDMARIDSKSKKEFMKLGRVSCYLDFNKKLEEFAFRSNASIELQYAMND